MANYSSLKWGISALALGAMMTPAQAQQTTAADSAGDDVIIVTGSKRGAVNIQDTPNNISVVDEELLKKTNAFGLDDIAQLTVGLTVDDGGPSNKSVGIRGLNGGGQVSVYFDEVQLLGSIGNVNFSDIALYDVERVEILRGPQGTLYGSGSQGGTLRYISRKPDDQNYGASARVDIGVRSQDKGLTKSYNGMVNIPVVEDVFAVRAVGYFQNEDGWVGRPDLGLEETNTSETYGGRVTGSLQMAESTKLLLSAFYQRTNADDSPRVNENAEIHDGVVLETFFDETYMFNATLEHDLGWGVVTATGSHVRRDSEFIFDVSQFLPPGLSGRVHQVGPTRVWQSEVRMASQLDGPLQFVAGGYYSSSSQIFDSLGSVVDPIMGVPFPAGDPNEFVFFNTLTDFVSSNKAIFGELVYQVTDSLSLIGGARLFELTSETEDSIVVSFFGEPLGPSGVDAYKSGAKLAFKAQASYDWTEDVLTYFTFSQGFREGGANRPGLSRTDGTPAPATFDPDFVDNFEFGWKVQSPGKQITFNGAVYYMTFTDIQVGLPDLTDAFGFTTNGDAAALKGIELETVIEPDALEGFSAIANMVVSSQQLTQDSLSVGNDGDKLPDTTGFSASVFLQQDFRMGGLDSYVSINGTYEGPSFDNIDRAAPNARETEGRALFGGQLGVQGDGWRASVYATNIFDVKKPVSFVVQQRPGLPDQVLREQPRTVGITLDVDI